VVDPTGAGDTFAGGFVGYLARHAERTIDGDLLRQAVAYGTAIASFNVEEFGTERIVRLTSAEIHDRVAALREIAHFELVPVVDRCRLGVGCVVALRRLAGHLVC
jgi:cytidine kinase